MPSWSRSRRIYSAWDGTLLRVGDDGQIAWQRDTDEVSCDTVNGSRLLALYDRHRDEHHTAGVTTIVRDDTGETVTELPMVSSQSPSGVAALDAEDAIAVWHPDFALPGYE